MNRTTFHPFKGLVRLLPLCFFAALALGSCTESDDTAEEYVDWQSKNETYWNNLYTTTQQKIAAGDTSWKILRKWSLEESAASANTDYVIAHVLTAGEGTASPLYTDTVSIRYKGQLLPSTSYPSGRVFDSTWGSATSASTAATAVNVLSGYTDGFATALQHMHAGDEWEVYIPWTLAYGTSATGTIPGYSVLTFNVQLVSFHSVGTSAPVFKAKRYVAFGAE